MPASVLFSMLMSLDTDDPKAGEFQAIIPQYQGLLFKIARSYCRDEEDRQDLVQEMLLQLWKAFPHYDDRYAYSTWMYRIALNVAISNYRRRTVRQDHIKPLDDRMPHPAVQEQPEKTQQLQLLEQFIAELPSLDKALMLLYLDDKPQADIAAILGISVSNVSTKISRIKEKLRQRFITHNA